MIEQGIGTFIVIVLVLIAIFVFSLFIPFYGFMRKRFKGLLTSACDIRNHSCDCPY